jgi:hypothetical protein
VHKEAPGIVGGLCDQSGELKILRLTIAAQCFRVRIINILGHSNEAMGLFTRKKDSKTKESQSRQATAHAAPSSSTPALESGTEVGKHNGPVRGDQSLKAKGKLSFWEMAYMEIEQDEENKDLLKHYESLLKKSADVPGGGQVTNAQQDDLEDSDAENDEAKEVALAGPEDKDPATRIFGNEQAMKDIARSKLAEMLQKEWVLQWKGREVFKVREQVTRIVKFTQSFSGLIG